MANVAVFYRSRASIPFAVTDANGAAYSLAGKKLAWVVGVGPNATRILTKLSDTSGDFTIATPSTGAGSVELQVTDYANLPPGVYTATLWIYTDGTDDQVAAVDTLTIVGDVLRT